MSVRRLAAITGISCTIKPYTSHSVTPKQKMENILSDKSLAERDFQVLITCGKKAMVVHAPATNPKSCIVFILNSCNVILKTLHDKGTETLR